MHKIYMYNASEYENHLLADKDKNLKWAYLQQVSVETLEFLNLTNEVSDREVVCGLVRVISDDSYFLPLSEILNTMDSTGEVLLSNAIDNLLEQKVSESKDRWFYDVAVNNTDGYTLNYMVSGTLVKVKLWLEKQKSVNSAIIKSDDQQNFRTDKIIIVLEN